MPSPLSVCLERPSKFGWVAAIALLSTCLLGCSNDQITLEDLEAAAEAVEVSEVATGDAEAAARRDS